MVCYSFAVGAIDLRKVIVVVMEGRKKAGQTKVYTYIENVTWYLEVLQMLLFHLLDLIRSS